MSFIKHNSEAVVFSFVVGVFTVEFTVDYQVEMDCYLLMICHVIFMTLSILFDILDIFQHFPLAERGVMLDVPSFFFLKYNHI